MEKLAGRTALITGGASGIGLRMARAFVEAGLKIAVADINEAALQAAGAALPGLGAALKLDVTRSAEWERALDTVEAALGPVEILCNNAGVGQGRFTDGREIAVAEMPEALWRMVLEINTTGTFLGARSVLPRMLARRQWGHIVNTASTGGLMAPGGIAAYCASKFAVVGLSESLRAELAPAGIGVSGCARAGRGATCSRARWPCARACPARPKGWRRSAPRRSGSNRRSGWTPCSWAGWCCGRSPATPCISFRIRSIAATSRNATPRWRRHSANRRSRGITIRR
jgi:NAD(P)-dependent dehydrogenase (short-subunit alcohol dehydrogenase family)